MSTPEISQIGKNDVQEMADKTPGESATPDNRVELAVKLMKIQKMIREDKGAFSAIAKQELAYWEAAAKALASSAKLRRIYGFDFKAVSKVAELMYTHIETRAAKRLLEKEAGKQLESLEAVTDNEVYLAGADA